MQKIDIGPFIRNIIIGLIFFAIGRYIVIQAEDAGRWVIFIGLIIFYSVWWFFYRRGKKGK